MTARVADLASYQSDWDTMEYLPEWKAQIRREALRVISHRDIHMRVQLITGVPWVWTACAHELECDSNLTRQILNGQRIDRVTTIEPIGCGPWPTWEASCIDAIYKKRAKDKTWTPLDQVTDWRIARLLMEWEKWNGGGYRKRGLRTPYLWSGSTYGVGVGYYESDGKYNPAGVSRQVGCAVLLREIMLLDAWAAPMEDAA